MKNVHRISTKQHGSFMGA